MKRARPLIDRLFDKVSCEDDCWIYTGHLSDGGYSEIRTGGEPSRKIGRHIAAYELFVGPVPAGMDLDHLCRRPPCFKPTHLEPVTRRENILRSDGWGGLNSRKTHCPQGHPYDEPNTRIYRGLRVCRACERVRALAYYHSKRKEHAA